ncbi:MAG: bifunctional adenosylcobinamide kinase/adenosylcobinamide-phosphate guanylyltransferase [Planctomycetia bacterium]|nr:bifunctional adenosylcobinamide kinase/adenosylcobinamide-phosphate guanylyltransferase [Planctomycetia bacterium]
MTGPLSLPSISPPVADSPENELARDFRDISGKVNQLSAAKSGEAYMMVAGIPLKLKGTPK